MEFIEKIIPLIDNKNNLKKLDQLLDNSQIPNPNINKVRSVVKLREENLRSCTIS